MHTVSHALCQSIIDYARRAAELGLVPNTQGNVSARDPETNLIAITPHDLPYGALTADDVVIVDLDGRKVAGRHDPLVRDAGALRRLSGAFGRPRHRAHGTPVRQLPGRRRHRRSSPSS